MEALSSGCDVLSYAILSNHLHVLLRIKLNEMQQWSDKEEALPQLKMFPRRFLDEHLGEPTTVR